VKLIVPIVNNNGDNFDTLMSELNNVRDKLQSASEALREASYANGRNYQLNPAGEGAEAYRQHGERVNTLDRIAHELLEIQYDISQQRSK
jgi:hypothetical protein